MSTLLYIRISFVTGLATALFYAVPAVLCQESPQKTHSSKLPSTAVAEKRAFPPSNSGKLSPGKKVSSSAARAGRSNNISHKKSGLSRAAKGAGGSKKLLAQGSAKSDSGSSSGSDSGLKRIQLDRQSPDLNFGMQPAGDGKVRLRQPISTDTSPTTGDAGKANGDSVKKLQPMGVIRFDADRRKDTDQKVLKGGLSIFSSLDEALVKSPRAAAIRAFLPITKAMFARATEQPSPEFFYDEGVRAEENRRLGAVFNWEPPWKLVFRLLVAKHSVGAKRLELMAQLWMLRADVRRAYTEVVVAQETLETLTSLYDLAHRLRVVSEKRFAAGDVPELDLLKARLAESRYDVEKRVGLRRVIRAKQQLNIIMGRPPEQPLNIPRLPPFLRTKAMRDAVDVRNPLLPDFSKPIPDLQYYINRGLQNRYELKTIKQNLVLNKANMRRAIGDIIPSPQFWIGQSAAGNPPIGPKLNAYYVGVSVPTQITSFNQGDIAEFRAQKRQFKYEYGAQKNVITAEVSSAYNNILAARQWLKVYEDHVLADSYEVARLARRSYEVGQSDITSTLQAQQNNVQIRSLYLEAISLYQKAFTELEMACGTPLLEED